eukprot:3549374-Rhodomonas_salina.1
MLRKWRCYTQIKVSQRTALPDPRARSSLAPPHAEVSANESARSSQSSLRDVVRSQIEIRQSLALPDNCRQHIRAFISNHGAPQIEMYQVPLQAARYGLGKHAKNLQPSG